MEIGKEERKQRVDNKKKRKKGSRVGDFSARWRFGDDDDDCLI